jgi:hypothetical protein
MSDKSERFLIRKRAKSVFGEKAKSKLPRPAELRPARLFSPEV